MVEQGTFNPKVVGSSPTRPIDEVAAKRADSGYRLVKRSRSMGLKIPCSDTAAISGDARAMAMGVVYASRLPRVALGGSRDGAGSTPKCEF